MLKRKSQLVDSLKTSLKQFFSEVKEMNESYNNFSLKNHKIRNKYDKFKSYLENKKIDEKENDKQLMEDINDFNTSFSENSSIKTLSRHFEDEDFMNELNSLESQESSKTINGLVFSSKSKKNKINFNIEEFEQKLESYYSKLENFHKNFKKFTSILI